MKKLRRALAPYLPTSNEFFISQDGFESTGHYEVNGVMYETFVNPDNPRLQLTVEVDTLKVVDMSVGRYYAAVKPREKKKRKGKA